MDRHLSPRKAKVWLFYLKHWKRAQLSCNVIREICAYIADFSRDLAHVTNAYLRIFHCQSSTWTPRLLLSVRIMADSGSSWAVLQDGWVFCSGGLQGKPHKDKKEAYILGREGTVTELPPMFTARGYHGVIEISYWVYTFGGCKFHIAAHIPKVKPAVEERMCYSGQLLSSCEKLDLAKCEWTALPSMREGKQHFNPCELNQCIYLCGLGSLQVEVFSPLTDLFLPLQLSLPRASGTCLYVSTDLLVVHSFLYVTKFTSKKAGQLVQCSQVWCPSPSPKDSNSQPVLDLPRGLFFIYRESACVGYCMETGVEVERFY